MSDLERKAKVKVTITAVTEWTLDNGEWQGTASHVGDHETRILQINEENDKTESEKWNDEHLPHTFESEIWIDEDGGYDEDEVHELCMDCLNESPELCEYDLYKAESCEFDFEFVEKESQK